MQETIVKFPSKYALYAAMKALLNVAREQLMILKQQRAAVNKNLTLDYYIECTKSFIENAEEVRAWGRPFRKRKYAGYNLRTMLEELGSISYFNSLSKQDQEKFLMNELMETCRNLFCVAQTLEEKELYRKLYDTFNMHGQPGIDLVSRKQLIVSVKTRLASMNTGVELYNTYGLLCWMPHSNFFYLTQQKEFERYERALLEAIAFITLYIQQVDPICGGATAQKIEVLRKKHLVMITSLSQQAV